MEENKHTAPPLLKYAAQRQAAFTAGLLDLNGYQTKTTFYADMTIAEAYGLAGVRDTFNRVNRDWRSNYEYYTEFVLVLNHKIWEHYESNEALARLYNELWEEAERWVFDNFTDEQIAYFYEVTD